MLTRRDFIKLTGASTIGWYVATQTGWVQWAVAQVPGGTLEPESVSKYVTPLLIPPVMPRAGTITRPGGQAGRTTTRSRCGRSPSRSSRPASPRRPCGATGPSVGERPRAPDPQRPLAHDRGEVEPAGPREVDQRSGGRGRRVPAPPAAGGPDAALGEPARWRVGPRHRPTFTETPGAYTGPVPIVTHVHGAVGVGDESDGTPRPGTCPRRTTSPRATRPRAPGTTSSRAKAASRFGVTMGPRVRRRSSTRTSTAPSTIWYHDHALGMTRLNVYAGPAGFYIVRGGPRRQGGSRHSGGNEGRPPGTRSEEGDRFPSDKTYFEIPIAVQDRAFDDDGSLFYPDSRKFFDEATAEDRPSSRTPTCPPIWNPGVLRQHAHGQRQHLAVPRRRAAALPAPLPQRLPVALPDPGLRRHPGVEVWQIGNEGGFLAAPVNLTADDRNRLLMGLAERADLIVDFTNVPVGAHVLDATSVRTSRSEAATRARTPTGSTSPTRTPRGGSCRSAWARQRRAIRRRRRISWCSPP